MTRVDGDAALRPQMFLGNFLENRFFQSTETVSGKTADAQSIDILPVGVFGEVALVEKDETRLPRRLFGEVRRARDAAIEHVEKKLGGGNRFGCARHSFSFDVVDRLTQASRVEKTNR